MWNGWQNLKQVRKMRYVYCGNSALEIITSNGFGFLGLFSISETFSALFRLHVLKLNFSRFLSLSVFIVSEWYLLKSIQLRPHVKVVAFNNKAPFLIRYGYMAGNRSRFSKHKMTGSSVFSLNLTYLRIPANPNYHMSIKKSQAILKCSSLRLVYAGLRKRDHVLWLFRSTVGQGFQNTKWQAVLYSQ